MDGEGLRRLLMGWRHSALLELEAALYPSPTSQQRIEWSCSSDASNVELGQHLSALANTLGGGFLIFGMDPDGSIKGIGGFDYKNLIRRIDSIARKSLRPPVRIEHAIVKFKERDILAYRVQESDSKPVHRRGGDLYESYVRPLGVTRRMSRTELANAIVQGATESLDGVRQPLCQSDFREVLHDTVVSSDLGPDEQLARGVLTKNAAGDLIASVTGLVLYAKTFQDYECLKGKTLSIALYDGDSRSLRPVSKSFDAGYEVTLQPAIRFILDHLMRMHPSYSADIRRMMDSVIRKLLWNSLIHQDFNVYDCGPIVEVFSDRIEFSNPGESLVDPLRIFEDRPCRNERLRRAAAATNAVRADSTGLRRVVQAAEEHRLPPPLFENRRSKFRAVFYLPRNRLSKEEKVRACYQHACLRHLIGERMSNHSLRLRIGIPPQNYAIISRIIADAVAAKLIKPANPTSKSKRVATYLPCWASVSSR